MHWAGDLCSQITQGSMILRDYSSTISTGRCQVCCWMKLKAWKCHADSQMPGCDDTSTHISGTMGSDMIIPNYKWIVLVVIQLQCHTSFTTIHVL